MHLFTGMMINFQREERNMRSEKIFDKSVEIILADLCEILEIL